MGALSARTLLVVCAGLLAAGCTCCVSPPPTLAPGALTREQAIAAAIRQAPSGMSNPSVGWAAAVQNPFTGTAGPPVWLVRLEGAGDIPSCAPGYLDRAPSPSDGPCLEDAQGEAPDGLVAVLDPFTGTLLGWSH
jgi:hypothetical protein